MDRKLDTLLQMRRKREEIEREMDERREWEAEEREEREAEMRELEEEYQSGKVSIERERVVMPGAFPVR